VVDDRVPRFGVIVPCRNEAAVVGRRIRNLARLDWPATERPHRILVVDDGSSDGTLEAAHQAIGELGPCAGLEFAATRNDGPHGKTEAMSLAIDALDDVDLLLLTDADVVFRDPVPSELAASFESDTKLGMACGAQEFVDRLPSDGSCGEPTPAGEGYDRFTAVVRRIESRFGRLFSVHGQCLAWRRELGIRPDRGFAADDLDLRQQVRALGRGVRLVPTARFLEEKISESSERERQAVRRAEAYFQFVRHTPHGSGSGALDALHWLAYRWLPQTFPVGLGLAVVALLAVLLIPGARATVGPVGVGAAIVVLVAIAPFGARTWRLSRWIERASSNERRHGRSSSWETRRT
jgi:hypothetical protein